MSILAVIALLLLAGAVVLWREILRAPLMPPDYDVDGQPPGPPREDSSLQSEEARQQPQEARN